MLEADVVAHAFKPSTWETEAGELLRMQGQPGLHSEFQDSPGCGVSPCPNMGKTVASERQALK